MKLRTEHQSETEEQLSILKSAFLNLATALDQIEERLSKIEANTATTTDNTDKGSPMKKDVKSALKAYLSSRATKIQHSTEGTIIVELIDRNPEMILRLVCIGPLKVLCEAQIDLTKEPAEGFNLALMETLRILILEDDIFRP